MRIPANPDSPPPPPFGGGGDAPGGGCGGGGADLGSRVLNGVLATHFSLPAHVSLGQSRALGLEYLSSRAHPAPVFVNRSTVPALSVVPKKVSYTASLGALELGERVFVDTASLNEFEDELLLTPLQVDASQLPTGVYDYLFEAASHFPASFRSTPRRADVTAEPRPVMVVNGTDSPYGAGWTLRELERLYVQPDQSVLLVEGSGRALRFGNAGNTYRDLLMSDPVRRPFYYLRLGEAQAPTACEDIEGFTGSVDEVRCETVCAGDPACCAARAEPGYGATVTTYHPYASFHSTCGIPGAIAGDADTALRLTSGPILFTSTEIKNDLSFMNRNDASVEFWTRFDRYQEAVWLISNWGGQSHRTYRIATNTRGEITCRIRHGGGVAPGRRRHAAGNGGAGGGAHRPGLGPGQRNQPRAGGASRRGREHVHRRRGPALDG